jgi:hypothetical protein
MDSDRLSAACRAHGIRLLPQFGPTVSGRTHAASDIDLAALLERRPGSLDAHAAAQHEQRPIEDGEETRPGYQACAPALDVFQERLNIAGAVEDSNHRQR